MAPILFTHSYFLRFDPKEFKAMMPYPPLGTLYAAELLRKEGYDVVLFDSMLASSESEILPFFKRYEPTFLVIYDDDFNYLTKMCLRRMREAAFTMTALGKAHGCTVIIHGSDAVDHANEYLEHGADFVICGEGEITLIELIRKLSRDNPALTGTIAGLAYRDEDGVRRTERRTLLTDLDVLPFPARDLLDIERYRQAWRKHHGYFSMNLVTTRGCPFHCNWCAKPIYGQVYHSRTPQNVAEEMLHFKRLYRPDHLWFCDDIFGLKPGWVAQFADAVQHCNSQIPFKCLSRADLLLKEENVLHLSRSGCQSVWIGAESGSQKILDAMEKGTTIEQIYTSASLLRSHGIRVGFFLQYGYPGETRADIEATLRMVQECMPDEIGISVSYPLPGTTFYENVRRQLGEKQNWTDSQDLELMFKGTFVPDFYRALHKITHKKFRIWQSRELVRILARHPLTFKRQDLRRLAAASYHAATLPALESELRRLESLSPLS